MTVRHHVLKYLGLNEDLVMKVLNDFYMDDSISGSDSSEKCFEFYSQIKKKKTLKEGSLTSENGFLIVLEF